MTDIAASRRRTGRSLFAGAAAGAAGYYTGVAAAPLVGQDLSGGVTLAGLPGAMAIIGTALGASLVTAVFERTTRRAGLATGYALGMGGALVAFLAVRIGSFPLVLAGSAIFGIGQAATQMTRYVVADLHEPHRRGRALGWIVWAGTIGGVAGPNLLAPAGRFATSLGQPELAGPYLIAASIMGLVAIAYALGLRPDPSTLRVHDDLAISAAVTDHTDDVVDTGRTGDAGPATGDGGTWRLPSVRVAIVVMITGQVVMVWLMSMTPVHIRQSGGDLERIGFILSAHIFGMFALSPLAGWVDDRLGGLTAVGIGLSTLATACILATLVPVGGFAMGVALFLLGLGWSFGFVAGSALLTRDVPEVVRAHVQGRVETAVWLSSAAASLGAGLLLDVVGYVGLAMVGLVALTVPAAFVIRRRSLLAAR